MAPDQAALRADFHRYENRANGEARLIADLVLRGRAAEITVTMLERYADYRQAESEALDAWTFQELAEEEAAAV